MEVLLNWMQRHQRVCSPSLVHRKLVIVLLIVSGRCVQYCNLFPCFRLYNRICNKKNCKGTCLCLLSAFIALVFKLVKFWFYMTACMLVKTGNIFFLSWNFNLIKGTHSYISVYTVGIWESYFTAQLIT